MTVYGMFIVISSTLGYHQTTEIIVYHFLLRSRIRDFSLLYVSLGIIVCYHFPELKIRTILPTITFDRPFSIFPCFSKQGLMEVDENASGPPPGV